MKHFAETLTEASESWVEAGLISESQRAALLARHPVEVHTAHRFIAIMATIGGVLVAAGIALVIASHWQQIGDWTKLVSLVLLLIGAHVCGWRLRISPGNYPRVGDACFMVGSLLFLLGIALVSQIYHLNSRPPNGVLLWWLGIAAIPWILRATGTQLLSVIGFLTWFAMELGADDSWLRLAASPSRWSNGELFGVAFFLIGTALFLSGIALRAGSFANFSGLHENSDC